MALWSAPARCRTGNRIIYPGCRASARGDVYACEGCPATCGLCPEPTSGPPSAAPSSAPSSTPSSAPTSSALTGGPSSTALTGDPATALTTADHRDHPAAVSGADDELA